MNTFVVKTRAALLICVSNWRMYGPKRLAGALGRVLLERNFIVYPEYEVTCRRQTTGFVLQLYFQISDDLDGGYS